MNLTDALPTAERRVTCRFSTLHRSPWRDEARGGCSQPATRISDAALGATPTNGRRLEMLESAARVFNDIANKGPLHG